MTSPSLATTTTTEPVDPGAVLASAYDATAGNYQFLSVVVVDGETLTTVSGIVDGNSVAASIQAGTTQVDYVRTPAGEWVTDQSGAWVPLQGEAPATVPLALLVEATDLALEEQNEGRLVLGATLGPGSRAAGLRVSVVIQGGVVTEIRYRAETEGVVADVTTTVSHIGVAGTVAAPVSG